MLLGQLSSRSIAFSLFRAPLYPLPKLAPGVIEGLGATVIAGNIRATPHSLAICAHGVHSTTTMADHDDTPAPAGFKKVTEGKATILFPDTNEVFYNPIQEFNRDISIAAIRTWDEVFQEERSARLAEKKARREADATRRAQEGLEPLPEKEYPEGVDPSAPRGITILEALSASGLRSIRYAKEIPNVRHILTNDLEADAVASIKRNAEFNGISSELLEPHKGDAM